MQIESQTKPQKPQTVVNVTKDSYTTDHQVLFSAYALNKFNLTFEDLKIKYKDIDKVISNIMKIDKNIIRMDFPISIFYDFVVLESEDYLITFDSYENKKKISICFYFNSYKESKEIFDVIQSFQDKDDEVFVSIGSYYYDGQKQLKVTENIKIKDDFEYNNHEYYPYLDVQEMFKQYVLSDSNILLLAGKAGSGKTKLGESFMKYLLESSDIELINKIETIDEDDESSVDVVTNESEGVKVAYIKNEDILADDLFWNSLREEEFHLVFLDDLDYSLLPRTQNISTSEDIQKNKFISNLLSFTDGIFNNTSNKTKFIVTTNREIGDIDTAVLRKGRTFDILQLRELKKDEALKIWLNSGLDKETFDKEFQTENILQSDLGSSISMKIKLKTQHIVSTNYLLEDNISIYNKYKKSKKIGL